METRKWLTLFLVPVVPLGGAGCVVRCNLCGLTLKGTPELHTQVKAMVANA